MRTLPIDIGYSLPTHWSEDKKMAHIFLFSYCCFFFFLLSEWEKTGVIMHFSVSLWILLLANLGRLQTVLIKRHNPKVLLFPCTVWKAKENAVRQTVGWGIFYVIATATLFYVLVLLFSPFYLSFTPQSFIVCNLAISFVPYRIIT